MKFYICPESQTVVEVVAGQPAPLTCDGKPMEELVPNSTNAAVEKHMPVLSLWEFLHRLTHLTRNDKMSSQMYGTRFAWKILRVYRIFTIDFMKRRW